MSSKDLPLAQSPIVGLQYVSYPLNILLCHEECKSWFHNDYVQLTWYKDMGPLFTFGNKLFGHNPTVIPWLQYQVINKLFLSKSLDSADIHKLIISAIDEGWYLYSSFDEFYVPNRFYLGQTQNRAYGGQTHFEHDFLLYGYDLENKEYHLYRYTDNNILESSRIHFDQFMTALLATVNTQDIGYKNLTFLKKKDNFKYEFDMQFLYDSIAEYADSKNSYERVHNFNKQSPDNIYGLELYDYLIKYFDLFAENNTYYDIRPLQILWEHKKCMVLRLKYLQENKLADIDNSMINKYEEIEDISVKLRNQQIKYSVTRRKDVLDRIKDNLHQIKESEKETLELLREELYKRIHR